MCEDLGLDRMVRTYPARCCFRPSPAPQTPSGGGFVNNLTLIPLCKYRIGRADIEESNGGVAMNARPPQASYPSGNFSDTSNFIAFPEYLKDR
ncbi:senescence-associated protein [Anaeramoeba flamelloides]|uniref:Senescence-associated protein n=1 Tax=Anaeramoeba flamelloides TaxID=1746091 RepID=A0AAV7ZED0_9EUKA|nr:senescence-associated protein [Anaeramoeba flamelloides]